jgi:4-amino-4-deoxy-L-arabinose transferase-like glycosyltransferase
MEMQRFKAKEFIVCLTILMVLTISYSLIATKNMYVEWDSMRYLLVAEEIQKGNGVKSPLIWFEGGPLEVQDGKAALTEQPPGYSIILAGLKKLFNNYILSARILNLISHLLISLIVLILVYKFTSPLVAFISALSVTFSLPLLFGVSSVWPEHIFTLTTLCSVFCILEFRSTGKLNGWWFSAALFASAAIVIRYAGIFLILVLLWEAIRWWKHTSMTFRKLIAVLTGPIIPIITFLVFLFRNYYYTNNFRGFAQPSPDRTLVEAFIGAYNLFFSIFGIKAPIKIIGISTIILAVILVLSLPLRKSPPTKEKFSKVWNDGLEPVVFTTVAYFGFIVFIMFRSQPLFEERFLYPLVPIIYIAVAIFVGWIYRNMKDNKKEGVLRIVSFLLIAGLSFGNITQTIRHFSTVNKRPSPDRQIRESQRALLWLEKNPNVKIVATNLPFIIAYHAKRSVLRLPQRYHNPWFHIPEDMESALPKRMKDVGAEYLILIGTDLKSEYWGKFISMIANSESNYKPFKLIDSSPNTKIYKLDDF